MKETLLESGKWREEQLIVTGSPSTDQWLMPRSTTNSMKTHPGLTTTFRGLSNSAPPAKMNHFEWLDKVEICGGDGTYFLPPEHAESWIFFEASLARVIACLVRTLTVDGTGTLEIRPHPFEREERYRYFPCYFQRAGLRDKKGYNI